MFLKDLIYLEKLNKHIRNNLVVKYVALTLYKELLGVRTNELTFKDHLLCTNQEKRITCYSINKTRKPETSPDGWQKIGKYTYIHMLMHPLNIY